MSTWDPVPVELLPGGSQSVQFGYCFKVELNEFGGILKHKARLCAQGFTQEKGVHYWETFAPTAKAATI